MPRPTPAPVVTPAPLTVAAPRTGGSPAAFGLPTTVFMGGTQYTNALSGSGWSTHNLDGRFNTLTGIIGRQDNTWGTETRWIRFTTGYGRNLGTFEVHGNSAPRTITVDVTGVAVLRVEIDAVGTNGTSIVFGNTMLNPPPPGTTPQPGTTPAPLLTAAPRTGGAPATFGTPSTVFMGGVQYTNAISGSGWSTHNLNGQFNTLTGIIGRQDNTAGTVMRRITFTTGYGRNLGTFEINANDAPRTISVPVHGVATLRVEIEAVGTNGVSIVFGNAMLHPVPGATPAPGTTPAPLLTAAPRTNGNPAAFGTPTTVFMGGTQRVNSIVGVNGWSTHNLNGRFNTLTGTIGRQDNTGGTEPRTIRFTTGYGRHLGSWTITNTSQIENISVPVQGVATLRIYVETPTGAGANGVTVVFSNTMLHPTVTAGTTPAPFLTAATRINGSSGFGFGGDASILGVNHANSIHGGGWADFDLGRRFTNLTGTIGRVDNTGTETRQIRFYGDNNLLHSFNIIGGHVPIPINLNVQNVTTLRVWIENVGTGASPVFTNALLHTTPTTVPTTTPTPTPAPISPLLTAAPRFDWSPNPSTFAQSGQNAWIAGTNHPNSIIGGGISNHHLGGRFNYLTVTIGRQDNTAGTDSRVVTIFGDNVPLVGPTLVHAGNFTPVVRTVSVRGVSILRVEIEAPGTHGVTAAIGNATLHPTITATPTPTPTPQPLVVAAPRVNDGTTTGNFGLGTHALINGVSHPNSIIAEGSGWARSTHHLNGRFTTLTATLGRVDVAGWEPREVRIYGDGTRIETYFIHGTFSPTQISLPVQNVNHLRIEIVGPYANGVTVALGDIRVQ